MFRASNLRKEIGLLNNWRFHRFLREETPRWPPQALHLRTPRPSKTRRGPPSGAAAICRGRVAGVAGCSWEHQGAAGRLNSCLRFWKGKVPRSNIWNNYALPCPLLLAEWIWKPTKIRILFSLANSLNYLRGKNLKEPPSRSKSTKTSSQCSPWGTKLRY